MLQIIVKNFDEFTTAELYTTLQLRSEVFVVEQNCVYQDLDGKDQKAIHVLGYKKNELLAYTRVFKPGDYFEEASIGRVLVKASARQNEYGKEIMLASIKKLETLLENPAIHLSAQTYLKSFYNSLGFQESGEEYLEDNIPHIKMIKR